MNTVCLSPWTWTTSNFLCQQCNKYAKIKPEQNQHIHNSLNIRNRRDSGIREDNYRDFHVFTW